MKVEETLFERNLLSDVFSYSKLNTFSKCPYKAYLRYIQGKREHGAYLIKGRAVHRGQEEDNRAKLEGRRLPDQTVLDRAVAELEEESGKSGISVDKDAFVEEHGAQLERYRESGERDKIRPVPGSVEAPFEISLQVEGEKAVLQGFVDVLSYGADNSTVQPVDYKAVQRPVSQKDVDNSLQFEIYRWGSANVPPTTTAGPGSQPGPAVLSPKCVSFVGAISGKRRQKPTTKVVSGTPVARDRVDRALLWVGRTIRAFKRAIKSGDFPRCAPESFWCSPGVCDFYRHCYPKEDSGAGQLVQIEQIRPVGSMPTPEWRK